MRSRRSSTKIRGLDYDQDTFQPNYNWLRAIGYGLAFCAGRFGIFRVGKFIIFRLGHNGSWLGYYFYRVLRGTSPVNRVIQILRTGNRKDAILLIVGIIALAVNVIGIAVVVAI